MNVYKLVLAASIEFLFIVVLPILAIRIGAIAPLANRAWLILLVTALALVIKSVIGDVVSGEFLFYKFGYDNCVMTFGAILTALALQLVSTTDLFPGMNSVVGLKSIPQILTDPTANRCVQFFVFLLFALLATLLTGRIASEVKDGTAKGPNFLSLFNFGVGLLLLAFYVLILVTKG